MTRARPAARIAAAPAPASWLARNGGWIVVLLVGLAIAAVRLRLAGAPLERDEGEYAYAGQLILDGVPPYALVYNMKFPGVYYAYALALAAFGQSAWGVHVGLIAASASSTALLYAIGRRLLGAFGGAVAAVLFAVLSLDPGVLGAYAHASHFILPPVLAGVLLALRAQRLGGAAAWILCGAAFGVAAVMSQMGACFAPLGLALAAFGGGDRRARRAWRRIAAVSAGALLPLAAVCALLASQGVLGKAVFWTLDYARAYVGETPGSAAWSVLSRSWADTAAGTTAFWMLAAVGALALLAGRWPRVVRVCGLGLAGAGALAVSPGFYFRNHYFVLLLPATALLGATAVVALERWLTGPAGAARARAAAALVPLALLGRYGFEQRGYLLSSDGVALTRTTYGANPFDVAPEIARYIADRTSPADRVAVLGSEPEIDFYAHRRSATGYIYTYPLIEPQPYAARMQQEMVNEIEAARPRYVVAVWVRSSWINSVIADQRILEWSRQYAQRCYDLVGVADIRVDGATVRWGAEASTYRPASPNVVYTLVRKGDGPCDVPLPR